MKKKRINIPVEEADHKKLKALAKRNGLLLYAAVRLVLAAGIAQIEKK